MKPAAPMTPTTLSSAAYGRQIRPAAARWSRGSWMLSGAAVVVGSTLGAILAVRLEPSAPAASTTDSAVTSVPPSSPAATPQGALRSASPSAPAATPSAPAATPAPTHDAPRSPAAVGTTVAEPTANPPAGSSVASPTAPDADVRAALVAQIKDVLSRFVAWSQGHPGARCPDIAALGAIAPDPWGHPLRIVCAEQPADQMAAVLSLGPDGIAGSRDDVASWMLGHEVTDIVRGPRWSSTRRGAVQKPAPGSRGGRGAVPITAPPDTTSAVDAAAATRPPAAPSASASTATPTTAAPRPSSKPASTGSGGSDTVGDGIPDRR